MTPVRPRPATVVVVVATLVLLTVLLVRGRDVLGWALAPLVVGALALMAYDCARVAGRQHELARAGAAALQELSRASDSDADTDVGSTLCGVIARATAADLVLLIEPGPAGLRPTAASGGDASDWNRVTKVDWKTGLDWDTGLAALMRTAAPVLISDASHHRLVSESVARALAARSLLHQPLLRAGAVVGGLVLVFRRRVERLGDLGRAALPMLADAVTVALTRQDLQRRLDILVSTDALTGLSTRRLLEVALSNAITASTVSGAPLSLLMLDVDRLSAYNTSFGRRAGDDLLRAISAVLAAGIRDADSVFRSGGDEFAVLLPGCAGPAARTIGEALRRRIPDGVTCSVGVAGWQSTDTPEALLSRAGSGLERARAAGRNRVAAHGDTPSPATTSDATTSDDTGSDATARPPTDTPADTAPGSGSGSGSTAMGGLATVTPLPRAGSPRRPTGR